MATAGSSLTGVDDMLLQLVQNIEQLGRTGDDEWSGRRGRGQRDGQEGGKDGDERQRGPKGMWERAPHAEDERRKRTNSQGNGGIGRGARKERRGAGAAERGMRMEILREEEPADHALVCQLIVAQRRSICSFRSPVDHH